MQEIYKALSKFQAECKAAPFDAVNPHFKSKYATLASLWDTIRPLLSKYGLSVVQVPENGENGEIKLTTAICHESGDVITGSFSMAPDKPSIQGTGSLLTYMRRYALSSYLGLVSQEDDDGNAVESIKKVDKPVKKNDRTPEQIQTSFYSKINDAIKKADGVTISTYYAGLKQGNFNGHEIPLPENVINEMIAYIEENATDLIEE